MSNTPTTFTLLSDTLAFDQVQQGSAGLSLGVNLGLPGLNLIDLMASVGEGEALVVVDGNVLERDNSGSLVDLGVDIGTGIGSNSSLVNIDGKIFGRGENGSLVDLGLNIGSGGVITVGVGVGGGSGVPGTGGGIPGAGADPDALPVFRFFNTQTEAHFYTANTQERDFVTANYPQLKAEGQAFIGSSNPSDGPEVFRFYNEETQTHFYTASTQERDLVLSTLDEYTFEGVAYTAYSSDGVGEHEALYRFFNTETRTHFYTASEAEVEQVRATLPQYTYEGIAYYVDVA